MRSVGVWMRDTFTRDENIDGTPERYGRKIHDSLKDMAPDKRAEAVESLRQYTNYYWLNHHNARGVPAEDVAMVKAVAKKAANLMDADEARAYLRAHGSPREAFQKFFDESAQRAVERLMVTKEMEADAKEGKSRGAEREIAKQLGEAIRQTGEALAVE